jgi:hypothetical protein
MIGHWHEMRLGAALDVDQRGVARRRSAARKHVIELHQTRVGHILGRARKLGAQQQAKRDLMRHQRQLRRRAPMCWQAGELCRCDVRRALQRSAQSLEFVLLRTDVKVADADRHLIVRKRIEHFCKLFNLCDHIHVSQQQQQQQQQLLL